MSKKIFIFLLILFNTQLTQADEAKDLVLKAIEHWRGVSSHTKADMKIIRPDYEKNLSLEAWTYGRDFSLVKFTAPQKDSGNATLMKGDDVWSYSPKTDKTIRIPPSMKSQSWMGSDFSYQDLAKDDDIIDQYDHSIIKSFEEAGFKITTVNSKPRDDAPVVWGKEELDIRSDLIIIRHKYFDQDNKLLKIATVKEVGILGGRIYPIKVEMKNIETNEITEIVHTYAEFDKGIDQNFFSTNALTRTLN